MRKLVTIQRIKDIQPIKGADRIETASVLGWKCVITKDSFKIGDLCIYFEVDSFLPICDFFDSMNFLKKSCYRKTNFQGEGYQIRTQVLRGQVSQGLLLPLDSIKEIGTTFVKHIPDKFHEGDDVTEIFGVVKYDPPEVDTGIGTVKGNRPYGIPRTEEIRIQSVPEIINELQEKIILHYNKNGWDICNNVLE